ncbi:hypothetical protein J6590_007887 [Homalodisca vitripennis]|nr:hypothetical protein J6590_007887 [Homalodisca vitripennis]
MPPQDWTTSLLPLKPRPVLVNMQTSGVYFSLHWRHATAGLDHLTVTSQAKACSRQYANVRSVLLPTLEALDNNSLILRIQWYVGDSEYVDVTARLDTSLSPLNPRPVLVNMQTSGVFTLPYIGGVGQ